LPLPPRLPNRPRRAALVLPALVVTVLAGCGSSGSTGSANLDPASLVPASAALYASAVVQPAGQLKTNSISVAQRLTHKASPFKGLLAVLEGSGGHPIDYDREVKPWLGDRAAAFIGSVNAAATEGVLAQTLAKAGIASKTGSGETGSSGLEGLLGGGGLSGLLGPKGLQGALSSEGVQGALVLDTTDAAKARSFLDARAKSQSAHTATYRGVSYQVSSGGSAEAIVGTFAVIGSEAGLKSVIDTHLGGAPLSRSGDYAKLASGAEAGSLANLYIDPNALLGAPGASAKEQPILALLRQILAGKGKVYLSLIPSVNSVALDVDTLASGSTSVATAPSSVTGAGVLGQLPGGSWLAVGLGNPASTLGQDGQGLRALASLASGISLGSFSIKGALAPFTSPDINLRHDLLSWMGGTGVFATGSGLNLQAGVVITSKNLSLSRAAVSKLGRAYRDAGGQVSPTSLPGADAAETVRLPNFPVVLTVADGQGKFVIGLGPASVQEALSPQSTLSGSAAYSAAVSALGHGIKPSALVDFPTLVGLAETLGFNQDPGISTIFPYLQSLTSLAVGGGETLPNGVKRSRVVLGLQQAG
jgi:hypothetical protein